MSEIDDLRREVSRLERQVSDARNFARETENTLTNNYKSEVQDLRRRMEYALQQHNEEESRHLQQKMTQLMQNYSNQINFNYRFFEQKISNDLLQRHQEMVSQIEQYYRKLQENIDEIVHQQLNQDKGEKRKLAQVEYHKGLFAIQNTFERAHQELFPGELDIFNKSLTQAELMINQGIYEASIATSVLVCTKIQDFNYRMDEKLDEWMKEYLNLMKEYYILRKNFEEQVLRLNGENISVDTAKYWMGDKYDDVFNIINQCEIIENSMLRYTEDRSGNITSQERYIKTGDAPTRRELNILCRDIKYKISPMLKGMSIELQSTYLCSVQRQEWAKRICDYMRENHNTGNPKYNGYGLYEEKDPRQLYCIKFIRMVQNKQRKYEVHIVPVLTNGQVENRIRLYMNFKMNDTRMQKRKEKEWIINLLKLLNIKKMSMGVGTDVNVLDGKYDENYILSFSSNSGKEELAHFEISSSNNKEFVNVLHNNRKNTINQRPRVINRERREV